MQPPTDRRELPAEAFGTPAEAVPRDAEGGGDLPEPRGAARERRGSPRRSCRQEPEPPAFLKERPAPAGTSRSCSLEILKAPAEFKRNGGGALTEGQQHRTEEPGDPPERLRDPSSWRGDLPERAGAPQSCGIVCAADRKTPRPERNRPGLLQSGGGTAAELLRNCLGRKRDAGRSTPAGAGRRRASTVSPAEGAGTRAAAATSIRSRPQRAATWRRYRFSAAADRGGLRRSCRHKENPPSDRKTAARRAFSAVVYLTADRGRSRTNMVLQTYSAGCSFTPPMVEVRGAYTNPSGTSKS